MFEKKDKLIRVTTVPSSLNILLKGQLKFLNRKFEVKAISSSGEDLSEVKEREEVDTIVVNMQRGISPLKDLISLFNLYRQFKKHKPMIVHSITPKAGLLTMLAGKLAGVPVRIHTFTGLIFPSKTGIIKKILIVMDKLLCWSATNVYPEGNGVKRDLEHYGITSKPLKVLANGNVNGIDLSFFDPSKISEEQKRDLRSELEICEKDFVFIFVGRLVGDKGINELIQAFKDFLNEAPDFVQAKLLLVGALEPNLDPLESTTLIEIESNPNIIAVGFQRDVRPYFSISNVLVFPSYREGFPNVVMQAGAMELPAIVTDINGCNEIVIEGKNGTIIPVKNVKAIKDIMLIMVTNREYYLLMKAKSRTMIKERYEQQVVWDALLSEYQRLLRDKGLDYV